MTETLPDDFPEVAATVLGPGGKLSVILPAYRLESIIGRNIQTICNLLEGHLDYEVVAVDDGSDDATGTEIRTAAQHAPAGRVKPVLLPRNGGKGNALRQGFRASSGTHLLLLDGDLDLSPAQLPAFLQTMRQTRADIVIGSKRHPQSIVDYPWHRRLASALYCRLVKLLLGLPVTDTQTGMKLFTRPALKTALDRMVVKSFAFDVELLTLAVNSGHTIAEAPIELHFGRKLGCLSPTTVRQVLTDTLGIFYRLRILRYYQAVEPVDYPNPPPLVSVIIACPAPSPYLAEALSALQKQTYTTFEVLVLPDAGYIPGPEADGLNLRIIPTGKVRPAEKRNRGAALAKGSIIALLDDDAAPLPDWLEKAVPHFGDPTVTGVGGPAITPPNDPYWAQVGGRVYQNPLVSGTCRYRYIPGKPRRSIDDYPSCNLLVRAADFRAIGGFSIRYWPGEDTILCNDLVTRGKRIVYDPWSIVHHHRRALFLPHLRQIGRYALHRGYFAKRFPATSLRIAYFMPSLLAIGLLAGFPLALLIRPLLPPYAIAVALYAALTFIAAADCRHPLTWLLTWLGIITTHIWYGLRFLAGLLATRMPCEVARFDHPAEQIPPTNP